MNKITAFLVALMIAGVANATPGKRDTVDLLPSKGDIGLGFDAMPFLSYFGTLGQGAGAAPAFLTFGNGQNAIWGKYFLEDNRAVRVTIRPGFGTATFSNALPSTGNINVTVVDEKRVSSKNYVIGAGYEISRGKKRVQGYYGGDLLISFSSTREKYTYGNFYADTLNIVEYTDDFDAGTTISAASRPREIESGNTFGLTLRGFLGVEYFLAPKFSVAAEYGWGLGYSQTGDERYIAEFIQGGALVTATTATRGKSTNLGMDTDVTGASIRLMFHF